MLEYPQRSPLVVAEAIKDLIQDKVVCDVGCGDGGLMIELAKYAKEVKGIDNDCDKINTAKKLGLDVGCCDALIRVPEAEVYYVWVGSGIENKLALPGTVIYGMSDDTDGGRVYAREVTEIRDVPFEEGDYKGNFHLYVCLG